MRLDEKKLQDEKIYEKIEKMKKKRGKKKQIKTHDHMTLWMWHLRDNLHESVYIVGAQP